MTNGKVTAFVLLAFVLGGVSGVLVAKKLLEEQYREEAQADIDDVKAYYAEKYGEKKIDGKYQSLAKQYIKPDLRDLANGRATEIEDEVEEEEVIVDDTLEETVAKPAKTDPYVITYDTFVEKTPGFTKSDLYYYRFDDVICDGKDRPMVEPENIIGWDWVVELKTKSTTFIRNEVLKADYEIHSFSKSYADEVSSRRETDQEKKYRRIARRKEAMDDYQTQLDEENVVAPKPKKAYVRKPKPVIDISEDEDDGEE